MNMKLLDGTVEPRDAFVDTLQAEVRELEEEVRSLRSDLSTANTETVRARREAARAVSELRRQLTPLYRALQAVFGELDAAGVEDSGPAAAVASNPRTAAIWDSWKARLGGQCAKVIDALLTHSEMNTTQLAIAIGTRRQNIPNLIYKLNTAGLINKNGGRFSLKQL